MEFSPPSTATSSVSSPNTDYPSLDSIEPQYKLELVYGTACGMDTNLESGHLPPLDHTDPADWSTTTLLHPSTSAGISNIPSADYDAFSHYESAASASYSHGMYTPSPAHAPSITISPHASPRLLSHSPGPASGHFLYRQSASPQPRIKMEHTNDYPIHLHSSHYPSPHGSHAMPAELGSYSSAASSSGYVSDVPTGSWPRSDYPPIDSQAYSSGSAARMPPGLLSERQPSRNQRSSRSRPRRLTTREEANYQCEVKGCGKLFSRSYNYKAHLETHDDKREYPFPCTVLDCNKRFVRKTDLQRHHQSVHMKEKNYKCDFCSRMFARKDTLRRHMDDGCSKRFDIGTVDVRSEGYDSMNGRSTGTYIPSSTQLPPLGSSRPRSPSENMLGPVSSIMRRGY